MRGLSTLFGFVAVNLVTGLAWGEAPRMHGRVNAALPAAGPQAHEQSWGVAGSVMLELPFSPQFGLGIELGSVALSDGEPPRDPLLVDQDGTSGLSAALAVHIRPAASRDPVASKWYSGFWGGASFGGMRTGNLVRMTSGANIGLDFALGGGGVAAGPNVGWLHVFQPQDTVRPQDANLLTLGVHALFDTAPQVVVDLDEDRDGIEVPTDHCPLVPEDRDGFQDDDGCPDVDNDGDAIADSVDECPEHAEDTDGFLDDDGCPEPDAPRSTPPKDTDGDGFDDAHDLCPQAAEDPDAFEDQDGCPDVDNDRDGLNDADDQCPNEAEIVNGYADEDGCPDSEQIRVLGDQILLDERVHFRTNSAVIRRYSHPLLMRLARLINEHPEYIQIEVQGHADPRGDPGFNERLSVERAVAVLRFLVDVGGVDLSRLRSVGLGSSQLFTRANNERAWWLNRRVDFRVTRAPMTHSAGPPPPAAAAPPPAAAPRQLPKPASERRR